MLGAGIGDEKHNERMLWVASKKRKYAAEEFNDFENGYPAAGARASLTCTGAKNTT